MDGDEPEKGQLEKILRHKRRFRVNKTKTAVFKKIEQNSISVN